MPNSNGRAPEISGAPWWALYGLALVAMLIFAGALGASCFLGNETLLVQMFTAAGIGFGTALGYFFGSSKGSQDKDASIATSAAKKDDMIAASAAASDATITSSAAALAASVPIPPGAPTAVAPPAKPPCPGKETQP